MRDGKPRLKISETLHANSKRAPLFSDTRMIHICRAKQTFNVRPYLSSFPNELFLCFPSIPPNGIVLLQHGE